MTVRSTLRPLCTVLLALAAPATALGQTPPFEGYLCCNMLSDGSWISDINYHGTDKVLVAAGTPVKVTGFGRWRLLVEIDGKALAIGNDYSRTLSMEAFAQRYVVPQNPASALSGVSARVRKAIEAGMVATGMTRAQVLMAVGYPIASYNPDLDAPLWRYWLDRSSEYQLFWGPDGRVERVFGAPAVRARVVAE
jgi:hypothetical protein